MEIIKKIVSNFIISDFIGINRNSVEYFQLLMKKVREDGTYINRLYKDYYEVLLSCLKRYRVNNEGYYVELGSGYGFFQDFAKKKNIHIIRTDVVEHNNLDIIANAQKLPFDSETVSAIFMFGVLHHIKNSHEFFQEAQRVLKKNGAIIMIEPTANFFAEFMYKISHSEPFDKNAINWIIPGDDPMTCANLALPEIIFKRDLIKFKETYPRLKLRCNNYHSPLIFQMSGGGPYKPPLGNKSYFIFKIIDFILFPFNRKFGMFSTIVVTKE